MTSSSSVPAVRGLHGYGPPCLLAAGDASLTRRAKAASTLSAVVVRFSRARKRYECQGILVEEDALTTAELQCLAHREARVK
jgi:hypothetical protein